jgi:hypothetical protein
MMSALMSDVIEERITASVCNAACNAGGKLLKVVEMSLKYGTQNGGGGRSLNLMIDEGDKHGEGDQPAAA